MAKEPAKRKKWNANSLIASYKQEVEALKNENRQLRLALLNINQSMLVLENVFHNKYMAISKLAKELDAEELLRLDAKGSQ